MGYTLWKRSFHECLNTKGKIVAYTNNNGYRNERLDFPISDGFFRNFFIVESISSYTYNIYLGIIHFFFFLLFFTRIVIRTRLFILVFLPFFFFSPPLFTVETRSIERVIARLNEPAEKRGVTKVAKLPDSIYARRKR